MEARLILSSGHDDLDKAALEAIKQCKATPGTSGGVAKVKKVQARFAWRND